MQTAGAQLKACATVLSTVVHGSYNNESAERWRRSFHLHVVGARTVDVEIPPHADPRQWEPEDSQLGASNCTPTASCLGPLVALRTQHRGLALADELQKKRRGQ